MSLAIDELLDLAFTPDGVVSAYFEYKLEKWERFSGVSNPKINIPLGADGVTYKGFEKELPRIARNISRRVQAGSYIFYPFREVDKPKDSNKPLSETNKRTLGIASIRDAIVQNILYRHVLCSYSEELFSALDRDFPVSFAYRKGKSAPLAATIVSRYINSGYRYIFDADLSKYFDTVNHSILLKKVENLIGSSSSRTYNLIRRFIRTDRAPYSTYRGSGWRPNYKIFHNIKPKRRTPKTDEGVPQGGVLSGLLANLYLHEFDLWVVDKLGQKIDLKYVRYADDFIVMVRTKEELSILNATICAKLESPEFLLKVNREKTKILDISDGLTFLGFYFDGSNVLVRPQTVERFKKRIREEIFDAIPDEIIQQRSENRTLRWLICRINAKIRGARGHEICPLCQCRRVGKPRSWVMFFQPITDMTQLKQLDKWIRQMLYDYMFKTYHIRYKRSNFPQIRKLRSLVNEYYAAKRTYSQPCLCDIRNKENKIWPFAKPLFHGKTFLTIKERKPFTVPHVNEDSLQISAGKKQYKITSVTIENLWERLLSGESLSRIQIEGEGIANASHIMALLASLPSVQSTENPITVQFRERGPHSFLQMKDHAAT